MTLLRSLALSISLLLAFAAQAGLPPGITGAWYNPQQSGHGLSVEIIAPDHALVVWHTFNTAGQPMTLYMDGPISGRRIDATVYAPRGMRFGAFNPAEVQLPVWGEIELEFSSCEGAELRWRALDPAFGSGSTALRRLTSINGLECKFVEHPTAAFQASVQRSWGSAGSAYAAIDENGRLWAAETLNFGLPDAISAWPGYASVVLQAQARENRAPEIRRYLGFWSSPFSAELQVDEQGGSLRLGFAESRTETWSFRASGVALAKPVRLSDVARTWSVQARDEFFDPVYTLRIESDGSFCYDSTSACSLRGQIYFHHAQHGFFDFTVFSGKSSSSPDRHGRGWLQGSGSNQRLIMIADNGNGAMALIGR
jgi:hypothetical protein